MKTQIIEQASTILQSIGLDSKHISNQSIRVESLLYMIYWNERLKNNSEEQINIKDHLKNYLGRKNVVIHDKNIFQNQDYKQLINLSFKYVKEFITPVQTVDLVIERENSNKREVLLFEREKFPKGVSLPGGLVDDSDENNELGIDSRTFAALRVAAEKVLYLQPQDRQYKIEKNADGENFYIVSNKENSKKIIIHPKNIYGYSIKENLSSVIRPSDPRHLVDTVGFKCEIQDDTSKNKEYFWETKENLLNSIGQGSKKFSFNHHKEIILHTLGKTSVENEMNFNEQKFIKEIIEKPTQAYESFINRFKANKYNPNTSFPEMFPTVNKILKELFTEDINSACSENPILIGFRDKVVNSLRHVSLKNRTFCPYLPTVNAIFDSIAFFDVIARNKKDFYNDIDSNKIIEHDPKEKANAAYHMYKYEYRMNDMMSKIPEEIIIPTFCTLSATDLMKVRGVPIRFVGLSKDFIYVDEFEQSPEEFLMHDINHSYRMMIEDEKYMGKVNISREEFIHKQNSFIQEYMPSIKISPQDSEKTREIKKLKKIILFEIFHEDAKPFLPEIVIEALERKEGGETRFELPVIDEKTNYMDIVDVLDTEISTLSYVRNKLQCGFYDKVDNQITQIVAPEYRKSEYIAQAALDMLHEMCIMTKRKTFADYEYMLRRVSSVGPNNIYEPAQKDEIAEQYSDGAKYLNPKRYKSNQKSL